MLFPIAVSAASAINVDQRGFAIAIMIAASASFATPISYQTNLMYIVLVVTDSGII
ncbi:hypothetical protein [Candidatus Kuenenia stuttgartiensis]|uniref:hypothetical protein n=1 Tax=Kuenenia stuttgartiensis TaxID=174633 RepID=UPI00146AFC44|nr:hypothetical protein [Candidatus Kuenenia stuttgartiensis]